MIVAYERQCAETPCAILAASAEVIAPFGNGRYEWNKRTGEGMIKAQRHFRDAIEKDPKFALAYSGLADSLAMGSYSPESRTAALKALEIDPDLAEPHASIGFVLTFHDWNWELAETEFRRAIELNPNYATAHQCYKTKDRNVCKHVGDKARWGGCVSC